MNNILSRSVGYGVLTRMSALFPSLVDEVVFWVVFVGGFVALVWAIKRAGGYKVPDSKRDRTEPTLVIALFFVGILLVPIVIGYARIGVLPSYLFYPGLILWIVGFALYAWSVRFLGRFQSGFVRVVAGHRVIQEGPYRLIRHPLYASELVTWIGLGLALQSWVALLAILVTLLQQSHSRRGEIFGSRTRGRVCSIHEKDQADYPLHPVSTSQALFGPSSGAHRDAFVYFRFRSLGYVDQPVP